jgi:Collagen triple helix repeat (20 copies)
MSGSRGPQGAQGCKGDKGDKGATGAQGAQGITGARGPGGQNGNKGAQGDKGDKGNKGNTGAQGLQGLLGRTGCIGRQGNTGAQGVPGNMGDQGYQGIRGPVGYQGDKGGQGDDGSSVIFGTTGSSTESTSYSGLSKIYFDENTFQIDPIDGSGIIISSGLKVGVTGSTISSYGHINTLLFNSDAGFDISQNENDPGTAIIGMNSTFKYWQVDGQTGLQAKGLDTVNFVAGDGITITPDKTASPYQSLTIASTGGGNSDISGPPPQLTFGNISYTSRYIYIPWEYPAQSTIIGDTYLPYIHSFSAYYTINDISHNIIVDGSGSEYIKGPPSSSNQPKTYITGIILTNVSTGTPTPGTCTQVQFPDNNISRWYYIHYDPSLSLLSEAGASGTITAYYSNYNTSSGVSNKSSKTLNGFSAAGIPSTSTDASFSYPDALLNTNNVDISVNVTNTTPYSNTNYPWIDASNTDKSTYQIQKYKYICEPSGSTIRYGVPVADASRNVSGDSSHQTIHYLYPDASYMLYEQVNNNSSSHASYSFISDPFPFSSQSLQVKALCSDLKFTTLTNSWKSAYLVTDTNRLNLKTNVIFTEPSGQGVTSDPFISPIHTLGTRGNLVPIGTTLLDISCTITKSGTPTPTLIDSVSISYKGFDTSYNTPAGSTGTGICTIKAADKPVDSYADSSDGYHGFYLETSNNVITITNSPTLFAASNQLNTIQLAYIRRNNVLDTTSTDISYSSYYFYYDPYSSTPVWSDVSFSAILRSTNPPITPAIQICGVYVLSGEVGVNATTIFSNNALGKYFCSSGNIITYSNNGIPVQETTLTNVSPAITTTTTIGFFPDTTTFYTSNATSSGNSGYISYIPSNTLWSNSFFVSISNYINCLGKSPIDIAPSTKKKTFYGIWDPLSISALTPTSIQSSAAAVGCRVATGVSDGTYPSVITITDSGVPLITDVYPNTAVLTDAGNKDLQLCNGIYATRLGSGGKGYLNYTLANTYQNPSIYTQNTADYSNTSTIPDTGYRYVTFAWILPPGTSAAPNQYTKVEFTITGLVGDTISNIDTRPTITTSSTTKEFTMQYRIQNGDTSKQVPSEANFTSVWINAFPGSGLTPSSSAVIANPLYNGVINGDNGGKLNSLSGTTLIVSSLISSAPQTTASSGIGSFYLYCRIGLPMECNIGFKNITTSFS